MGQTADKVYLNGKIYSMDKLNITYEALAVKDGILVSLGSSEECVEWIGFDTELVDLDGKIVLPAFSDSHLHAPGLAYDTLFNMNLYEALSAEETLHRIKTFVNNHPELEIFYGRGYNAGLFGGKESIKGPRMKHLDEICPDKPIILADFGGNSFWMNSKAFECYHITNTTESPEDGIIELDEETGELWGILREGARVLVPYQTFTEEQTYKAAKWFQKVMNSFGYTSVLAFRPPGTVEPRTTDFGIFKALENRGELTLRVQGARDMNSAEDIDRQLQEMKQKKVLYESDLIKFTTAKFFIDGVIESATAFLSEPYGAAAGKGPEFRGKAFWSFEKLSYTFQRCMEERFQIYCHTIGDGASHLALDALESAYKNMGMDSSQLENYRHTLTHLQLIDRKDIERLSRLKVIAGVQPYWHFKSPTMWWSLEYPLLGARAELQYPLASLLQSGVVLVASSDYPVTPVPNPFYAIQAGVTRNLYHAADYNLKEIKDMDDPKYLLNPSERIPVHEMIRAFTVNAAYARFEEATVGSLEIGKSADFIIVDRDPFEVDPLELQTIKIEETVFLGKTVFSLKN